MNVDDLINFLMNDLIYDRIIEESMESHLNDIFKREDKYEINLETKKQEKEENCLICLDMILKDEEVFCIPCGHSFHKNCLRESVSFNHLYCPTCRYPIPLRKKNEHHIQYHF